MREAADRCSIHSTPIRSHGLQQDRMREQDETLSLDLTHVSNTSVYTCKEGGTKQTGIT